MDNNTTSDQMNRLRSGYRPTDAEVTAWNVAQNIDGLRRQITDTDLSWIMPAIAADEGASAAFHLALLQPLAAKPEVSKFLAQRFETAGPYLKSQLLWRLLDDNSAPGCRPRKPVHFRDVGLRIFSRRLCRLPRESV